MGNMTSDLKALMCQVDKLVQKSDGAEGAAAAPAAATDCSEQQQSAASQEASGGRLSDRVDEELPAWDKQPSKVKTRGSLFVKPIPLQEQQRQAQSRSARRYTAMGALNDVAEQLKSRSHELKAPTQDSGARRLSTNQAGQPHRGSFNLAAAQLTVPVPLQAPPLPEQPDGTSSAGFEESVDLASDSLGSWRDQRAALDQQREQGQEDGGLDPPGRSRSAPSSPRLPQTKHAPTGTTPHSSAETLDGNTNAAATRGAAVGASGAAGM